MNCYISHKIYFTKGELHVITHKTRTTLHDLAYLTCSIQETNKISVYSGKTFFISETDVLTATSYDLPQITKSQLKSKLAHTLLRNIDTSDLLHNNVLTLHRTENEKSLIAFQCISDTFLFVDTAKIPCNTIDIKWIENTRLVTLADKSTLIDQHILYKQNSLNLNFNGMLLNKLPLDQKIFSNDLNNISQIDRLKLYLQRPCMPTLACLVYVSSYQ